MFGSRQKVAGFAGFALFIAGSCSKARRVYAVEPVEHSPKIVRVGTFASLSGPDREVGASYQNGFRSAIDEWNSSDEARDLHVELVTYDDQSRASAMTTAVERLTLEDRVVIVAGGFSAERVAVAANAVSGAIVACPGCAHESDANVIGLAPSLRERAELLADLVVKTMNMSNVAILARQGVAADRAAGDAFRASLKSRNVATAEPLTFTPETIGDVLAKLASDAPQAVLVAMDGNEAALVGRAMRRRAVPSALLFFGVPNRAALPEADRVSALEGALFPGFAEPSSSDFSVCDVSRERELLGRDAAMRLCRALEALEDHDAATLRPELSRVGQGRSLEIGQARAGRFHQLRP